MRADGTVRATMPFALRGGIVEGLELRLAGGEIVEAHATRGEDLVRAEIALDDGARRLGELALVDASSRVGETGLVFRNTLFDENAASHIAWGAGLAWTVDGVAAEEHGGRRAQRLPDAHRLHDRLARGRGRRRRAGRRDGPDPARRALAARRLSRRARRARHHRPARRAGRCRPASRTRCANPHHFPQHSPMCRAEPSRIITHGVWLRAEGVRAGGLCPGTVSDGGMGIAHLQEAPRGTRCARWRSRLGSARPPALGGAGVASTCQSEPSSAARSRSSRRTRRRRADGLEPRLDRRARTTTCFAALADLDGAARTTPTPRRRPQGRALAILEGSDDPLVRTATESFLANKAYAAASRSLNTNAKVTDVPAPTGGPRRRSTSARSASATTRSSTPRCSASRTWTRRSRSAGTSPSSARASAASSRRRRPGERDGRRRRQPLDDLVPPSSLTGTGRERALPPRGEPEETRLATQVVSVAHARAEGRSRAASSTRTSSPATRRSRRSRSAAPIDAFPAPSRPSRPRSRLAGRRQISGTASAGSGEPRPRRRAHRRRAGRASSAGDGLARHAAQARGRLPPRRDVGVEFANAEAYVSTSATSASRPAAR